MAKSTSGVVPVLYKAFARTLREFERERIPCIGIAGTDIMSSSTDTRAFTRSRFDLVNTEMKYRGPASQERISEGFSLLRRLQTQLRVLKDSDLHARKGLAWFRLFVHTSGPEVAMRLPGIVPVMYRGCDPTADKPPIEFQPQVMEVCAQIRDQALSFASEALIKSDGQLDIDQHSQQCLRHLSEVFFKQNKFRIYPHEWVYDGLDPLCLTKVVVNRKGMPITLACLYWLITSACTHGNAALFRLYRRQPPAPVVLSKAHLRGRSSMTPAQQGQPTAEWIPYVCTLTGKESSIDEALRNNPAFYVDIRTGGEVLEIPDKLRQEIIDTPTIWHIDVIAELTRIMVMAHQRRGESDEVAFWMWQKMALDPSAEEWNMFFTD